MRSRRSSTVWWTVWPPSDEPWQEHTLKIDEELQTDPASQDDDAERPESGRRAGRERIAILGGGPSALTVALMLTSTRELRDRYDITVYQMGWRLGGKGASGRSEDGRIEEHGLHVLFGFYQNFFHAIRQVYAELDRPEGHPLRTWRQAFHPRQFAAEEEFVFGRWDPWLLSFPRNGDVPGSEGSLPTLPAAVSMLVQLAVSTLFGWRVASKLARLLYPHGEEWETQEDPPLGGREPSGSLYLARAFLEMARGATHATRWIREHAPWMISLAELVRRVGWHGVKRIARLSRRAHRTWLDLDALLALSVGIVADGLLVEGGFNKVDDLDYREWLLKHGLHRETLDTTLVRTIYDAAFSYEGGDPGKQRVSAGSAARLLIRSSTTFKGAGFYRMAAGMGDVVFAPVYEVLKGRGVRFEFFHKVEALELSEDGGRIERIRIDRQVRLREGLKEYSPLERIKGLECWPAEPLWHQIEDPDRVRGVDLESYYSGWKGEECHLDADKDFDKVVFAIPIAAVRFLCRELIANERTPRWRAMSDKVKSVQTLALQLWFTRDLHALGWDRPEPLLSLFAEPLNTWCDMSQVLRFEDWKEGDRPLDVSYFTGAQRGPIDPPDPADPSTRSFPEKMTKDAREAGLAFLEGTARNPPGEAGRGGLTTLMPGAASPWSPAFRTGERNRDAAPIDWGVLVDPRNRHGKGRYEAQYWRSNCGPSERCTLSLPDTNQYRMKAGETGYPNLFVTGDWTDNGLYLAFMEGTFQSGILTARAVSGVHFPIIGEWLNNL